MSEDFRKCLKQERDRAQQAQVEDSEPLGLRQSFLFIHVS